MQHEMTRMAMQTRFTNGDSMRTGFSVTREFAFRMSGKCFISSLSKIVQRLQVGRQPDKGLILYRASNDVGYSRPLGSSWTSP